MKVGKFPTFIYFIFFCIVLQNNNTNTNNNATKIIWVRPRKKHRSHRNNVGPHHLYDNGIITGHRKRLRLGMYILAAFFLIKYLF